MIAEALQPLLVSLLTQGAKKTKSIELSKKKKAIVRFIVLLLSYLVSVGGYWLGTGEFDPATAESLVQAGYNAVTAFGIYHFGKK